MKNVKYWFEDNRINIGSTFLLVAVFAIILFLYKCAPMLVRERMVDKLEGRAPGVVTHIEPVETITESLTGGKVAVGGFRLTYQYLVGDSLYYQKEYIDRKAVDNQVYRVLMRGQIDTVQVKYSLKDPNISRLVLNHKSSF